MNLEQKVEELSSFIPKQSASAAQVSNQSVGWHIDHCFKVIAQVEGALSQTDPNKFKKPGFQLWKAIVMTTGYIPRGKVKAPKVVRPEVEEFTEEALRNQEKAARKLIDGASGVPAKAYFEHPIFGHIARDEAQRFLAVHTHHHLKIIKDILKG